MKILVDIKDSKITTLVSTYILAFSCVLFFKGCNSDTKEQYWPKEMNQASMVDTSTFSFVILNDSKFIINLIKGEIYETKNGKLITEYKLQPNDETIAQAFLAYSKDELLVYYTPGNAEGTDESYLNIFNKNSKKLLFSTNIGLIIGLPVIKDGFTYINSYDFIGKINLNTGQYAWKHNNLYNSETGYNGENDIGQIFDSTIIKNNNIIFLATHEDKTIDSIIVDDISGNIVREVKKGIQVSF